MNATQTVRQDCPEIPMKNGKGNWYEARGKRWMDIAVALLLVVLCAPLYVAIAIAIRLTSSGPALLRQPRVGKDGKLFNMLKFRTMKLQRQGDAIAEHASTLAAHGVLYKVECDPRVTRIGAILRRLSLDELPQLFNVMKGDMSLVGPRPLLPFMVAPYPNENRARTHVVPGLTGLWQITARGKSSSVLHMIEYDLAYQTDISFRNDLRILWRTIPVVCKGTGVK